MTVRELIQKLIRFELDDEVTVKVIDADACDIDDVRCARIKYTPVIVVK